MYSIGALKVSKWQLALMLGAPLMLGVGMYVYNKCGGEGEDELHEVIDPIYPVKSTKAQKDANDDKKKRLENEKSQLPEGGDKKQVEQKKPTAVKLTPLQEANALKEEGNNFYRSGKYDEAIEFYDKAIEKCPKTNRTDLAIFYQNRAASYEMLKKWSKVKEDCTTSLQLNPRYCKAYYRRARAYEATAQLNDCLEDVTATCILETFQNNSTIMYADRVLKETGRIDAEKGMKTRVTVLPSDCFINTYLRSFVDDPLQTMAAPPAVIADTPPRGYRRAKHAFDEKRFEEVISACTEEIESSEAESQYKDEALLMRGTFHLLCGSFFECKADLDALIANENADVNIRTHGFLKRASLYIQMDDQENGLKDFDAAEQLQPNNADVFHQRAQILLLLEHLAEAVECFDKALAIAPEHAIAHVQKFYTEYRMAIAGDDQNKLALVLFQFEKAIDHFPNCIECHSLLAQVLSDQQQYPRALQYYEHASRMMPDSSSLLVHQAIMMLQWRGDVDKAVHLLNRAIKVDPKCELAYETLGTVEVQRANLERAVELFEKAIKYAKSQSEMVHIYSLRNAAIAQIKVTQKLGIDMSTISQMAQSGVLNSASM